MIRNRGIILGKNDKSLITFELKYTFFYKKLLMRHGLYSIENTWFCIIYYILNH